MIWQEVEELVRSAAGAKFCGVARSETIVGVKCDCVIHLDDGSVILIEISKDASIGKLRLDLAKFATLRQHFISQDIFPRCFFVTEGLPTPATIAAGEAHRVKVFSVYQFLDWIFALKQYFNLRSLQPFGSAVDLYSGKPDTDEYVPVEYLSDSGESYDTTRIAIELTKGKCVVLIGDFGAGKSRCIREVFSKIEEEAGLGYYLPLAINLRDNWGLKRASELITRHFEDLGLHQYVPDLMKIAFSRSTIFLLDGFDEIGAQTWSDDPTKLVDIRRHSLSAVNDLIGRSSGGVLVAGREHYFNNDEELLTCLGVSKKHFVILRCPEALTPTQFTQMIGRSHRSNDVPAWVPRKPLIAKLIRDIDPDARQNIFDTGTGQVDFWDLLIGTLCERESLISNILDPLIIRDLYSRIGRLCRKSASSLGPLSIKSINETFEQTTGRPPTDESAIILQRLPGLGRIGAESLDRQFVDEYILDGLKAEDVIQVVTQGSAEVIADEWKHPVGEFGAFYIATRTDSTQTLPGLVAFIKRHKAIKNAVLLSDLTSALMLCEHFKADLTGVTIHNGRFAAVSLADAPVSGVHFNDCYFDSVDITDAEPVGLQIKDSAIGRISGATSQDTLPGWIVGCEIGSFQSVNTLAAIRKASLTTAQTFLLSSLRKLFLQPGSGRRRSSMFKGYADISSKRICEKVITILKRENFYAEYPGATEPLYIPNRAMTARAKVILGQITQSRDDVWLQVTRLKSD